MFYKLAYLLSLSISPMLYGIHSQVKTEQVSSTQTRVEIACKLAPDEVIFKNSLQFSTNVPSAHITQWFAASEPQSFFDSRSKKTEAAYGPNVTFVVIIESAQEIPAHTIVHMHYATNKQKHPQELHASVTEQTTEQTARTENVPALTAPQPAASVSLKTKLTQALTNFTTTITSWIQDTEIPLLFKFLLAFLIGIMMSLTPCIYPMIPITMGILQANKVHSLWRGFSLASAYTAGLSTTFAVLGMLAAFGGAQFGSVMNSPLVILPIIFFFGYLGFSMLGFYEMYIPRFMQPRRGHKNTGSLLSAFSFGIINGTVASPCLSPGLALILGIVSGMANPFLGFLLLFVFGIGSSFPLLIIGTFSSSLHVLPRAGKWMIEFKKVFGFLLLGMCIYYLKSFMPEWTFYLILALFIVIVAAYYLHYGLKHKAALAQLVGIALCLTAAFVLTESYRVIMRKDAAEKGLVWLHGYEQARLQAVEQKKLLLLDFMTQSCSLCKLLDKKFFAQERIALEVPQHALPVKIDCTDNNDLEIAALLKKFNVLGFPTILLVDPAEQTVIKRWLYADLNGTDPELFIRTLERN